MIFHSLEWSDEQTLLYTVSATDAVIDQGRIDPHRICILGDRDSGGYAADHALSHQAARLRAMEEIDRFLDDHL
jgi:hypothetical protein